MPENETGAKWWFRYVIVPILGGGGVVAIIFSSLTHTTHSSDDPHLTQSTPGAPSQVPAGSNPAALPQTVPITSERSSDFYLRGITHEGTFRGESIVLPHGEAISVVWKVEPEILKGGSLSLYYSSELRHGKISVENEGTRNFRCETIGEIYFLLIVDSPDGSESDALPRLHGRCN